MCNMYARSSEFARRFFLKMSSRIESQVRMSKFVSEFLASARSTYIDELNSAGTFIISRNEVARPAC